MNRSDLPKGRQVQSDFVNSVLPKGAPALADEGEAFPCKSAMCISKRAQAAQAQARARTMHRPIVWNGGKQSEYLVHNAQRASRISYQMCSANCAALQLLKLACTVDVHPELPLGLQTQHEPTSDRCKCLEPFRPVNLHKRLACNKNSEGVTSVSPVYTTQVTS